MNCLKVDPNLLTKMIDPKIRDFTYTCLDLLEEYNLPINIYYAYFLGIGEFKLKNIWNHMILRWNKMKRDLKENEDFINSTYSKDDFHQIHMDMNDFELNELVSDFIGSNQFKGLFVCNCIQNYIGPK